MTLPVDFVTGLVQDGSLTTSLALQEAAYDQVNNASNTTNTDSVNQSWGKAIPQLLGHTFSDALPVWTGVPRGVVDSSNNETDYIDFAVMAGYPGPRESSAVLIGIQFNGVPVYDTNDAFVALPNGEALSFTFYDGTQTAPDPTIVAAEGDNVPAFTGRIYLVIRAMVTRTIDVGTDTTTTYFDKLPTVTLEISQVAKLSTLTAKFHPFDNPPQAPIANYHEYMRPELNLYYTLDPALGQLDVWNTFTRSYVGRVVLDQWDISIASTVGTFIVLASGEFMACSQHRVYLWDGTTGALLDSKSNAEFGDGLGNVWVAELYYPYVATGFSIMAIAAINNGKFDVVQLPAGQVPTWGISAGNPRIATTLTNGDIANGFKGTKVVYATVGSRAIYRIVLCDGVSCQVGLITNDGSDDEVDAKLGSAGVMYTLPDTTESFQFLLMAPHDNTRIYAVVALADTTTELRTYGNFYYVNPQKGGTPPNGNHTPFNDYNTLIELSRTKMLGVFTNPLDKIVQHRDRRYANITYPKGNATLVVMNFVTGKERDFTIGHWISEGGDDFGDQYIDLTPFYLPAFGAFPYFSNGSTGNLAANPVAGPGLMYPAGLALTSTNYTLADMFGDLAILAGYELGDAVCVNLDDLVEGVQLNQAVGFSDLFGQLCAAFRVDLVELPDGSLLLQRRLDVTAPDFVITPDMLLLAATDGSGNSIAIERVATNELPTQLQLSFINSDASFVVGAATVRRISFPQATVFGKSYLSLSIPVIMGAEDAVYYAGIALFDMWAGKTNFSVNTGLAMLKALPGDFVELIRPGGRADLCKVTQVSIGADRTIALTLSSAAKLKPLPYYQGQNKPTVGLPASVSSPQGTLSTPSIAGVYATVIDNVPLSAADFANNVIPVYYVSSAPVDVYTATSAEPEYIGTTTASVMGTVVGTVPSVAASGQTDIHSDIAVNLVNGTVQGVTDDAFRAGTSVVLIGAPGRWEVLWFRDAVTNGNVVTLSTLRRGMLGTEAAINLHEAGDIAVFLSGNLLRSTIPLSLYNGTASVFAVPPGKKPGPIAGNAGTLTLADAALTPLAPTDVKAVSQNDGSVLFTWHREDPQSPADDFWNDPPLTYAPESYTLTLPTNAGGKLGTRVVNLSVPQYTYSAADIASDGNTGVVRLNVTLVQNSAAVGPGTPFKDYVYVNK